MGNVPSNYTLYLESEEWAEIRRKVLERDGHKCVHCGTSSNLRIHHLTYINLFHEELHDLITVCDDCHSAYHDIAKRAEYCVEAYYPPRDYKAEREEEEKRREEEQKRREDANAEIERKFKELYIYCDFCKNGPLDLTDFTTMNKILETLRKEAGLDYLSISKKDLQKWVICRRMEFFARCLDKGLSLGKMIDATKFSEKYLVKNYRRDVINQYLDEERTVKEITNEKS